jgi:hypothetical protein
MNGSAKIQTTHRERLAIVCVRPSDPKQVLKNRESGLNQRALKGRLIELGWKPNRVLLLDEDQGHSAKDSAGRDGFRKLAADVGLGKVGIVMGYEVSRLSRNNADWYRLLELCALFDTPIAGAGGRGGVWAAGASPPAISAGRMGTTSPTVPDCAPLPGFGGGGSAGTMKT